MVVGLFGFSFCGFVFLLVYSIVAMNADSLGNLRHTRTQTRTEREGSREAEREGDKERASKGGLFKCALVQPPFLDPGMTMV